MFTCKIGEIELTFETNKTSFSPLGADKGTLAMLEVANLPQTLTAEDKLLDLGCGYGLVGFYAAKLIPPQNIVMSDISKSCIELAKKNAEQNCVPAGFQPAPKEAEAGFTPAVAVGLGAEPHCNRGVKIIHSDGFTNITDSGFTIILSNPPYHADFKVPKHFIEKGFNRLKIGGVMYMVTKRKDWYKNKLTAIFGGVKVFEIGEYYVFRAEKRGARYANK